MRTYLAILLSCMFIVGCQKEKLVKNTSVITEGSDYAEIKAVLIQKGLEEKTDLWEIAYPESQKAYTYFLKDDIALIIFVNKKSGKVMQLSRYEKVDQPKSVRNWIDLNRFDMEKELSNKPNAGDS